MMYKTMGGNLKMKSAVVPHIFDCQPRRPAFSPKPRAAAVKIARRLILKEAVDCKSIDKVESQEECSAALYLGTVEEEAEVGGSGNVDKGCQARPVGYRSVGVMCTTGGMGCSRGIGTQTSAKAMCSVALSPIKIKEKLDVDDIFTTDSSDSEGEGYESSNSDTEFLSDVDDRSDDDEISARARRESTRNLVRKAPKRYIGLSPDNMHIVNLLQEGLNYTGKLLTPEDVVFIILIKVRLNDSFGRIGSDFGVSKSQACRLFGKFVNVIAKQLKQLIVWPSSESIIKELPVAFQARYFKVESIIDCFEVEIEKAGDSVHQALTWSDYKKCNTIKYLVSITPDGLINFISSGYGGRASDVEIVKKCNFLDKLRPGVCVMADRGFKHLQQHLLAKGCNLVRPPSVSDGEGLSKEDARETKKIASL
ncbi:uncharacterized protein LOC124169090 [Ischnura elegans]|uniref:uncharacterized protein LOC124169090 n=1 Tax=Ischnura elegans TaxID=197161 RepID=UPI001ED87EFC|nr:uncharacterized protein LOC124169090 [Ischnura elegans]